jgi:hypothetical protein
MTKIAKFGGEMLQNEENIALQSLQILYTFVLCAEIAITSGPKMVLRVQWVERRSRIKPENVISNIAQDNEYFSAVSE